MSDVLPVTVKFVDFWEHPSTFSANLHSIWAPDCALQESDTPDYLFYSCTGVEHRKYKATKIFYTGESYRPNFFDCDFSFSFEYDDYGGRNYRLPLFLLYGDVAQLLAPKSPEEILKSKTKFCNFVFSNPDSKERIRFFEKLSRYKKVDSGGKVLNNIGYIVKDKLTFIKDYKFTIAFENKIHPGYTTEKIFQPMLVNSLPVYRGNPSVETDFNPESFINTNDCSNIDEMVDLVVEADRDDDVYCRYFSQPYFPGNAIPAGFTPEAIRRRMNYIFLQSKPANRLKRRCRPLVYSVKWRMQTICEKSARVTLKCE